MDAMRYLIIGIWALILSLVGACITDVYIPYSSSLIPGTLCLIAGICGGAITGITVTNYVIFRNKTDRGK